MYTREKNKFVFFYVSIQVHLILTVIFIILNFTKFQTAKSII